jgi:D-alanyl-D-alanine dipeptidase
MDGKNSRAVYTPSYHSASSRKFVDLASFGFLLEPRYYFFGWSRSPRLYARESAARALVDAEAMLPVGFRFKVWDAWRTRKVERAMLGSFRRRLRLMYPRRSQRARLDLLYRFGGRPRAVITRPDTHRNGGSFDITIVDRQGVELYMGTDHDDLTPRAALDYFEGRKRLTPLEGEARRNRRKLRSALSKAGFLGYAPEWWHWSYAD